MNASLFALDLSSIADLAPWILFCGLMLVFSAPVMRRAPKSHAVIPATPQEIWPLLQPDAWSEYAHWKHWDDMTLTDPERRVWSYTERAPLRRPVRKVLIQQVYEPFIRIVETAVERDGKEIPDRDLTARAYTLRPCDGGTMVEIETRAPRLNFGSYWITRNAQQRRLLALRSYIMAHKPEPADRRHIEWRGWAWPAMLFAPYVGKALFGADMTMPAIVTGAIVTAIVLREIGHAIASVSLGRKKIVVALSPLTGAATMRARAFRSKLETAIVSLSGPAFAAAVALTMTPAIDRVARLLSGVDAAGLAQARIGGSFNEKIDLACMTLATIVLVINLLALIPFRSSLGAVIVQSVAQGAAARIALVTVDFAAAAMAFPGVTTSMWTAIIIGMLPPLLLWLVLWNVSGGADGFAPLPRRQATKLVGSLAGVFIVCGIVKVPLHGPIVGMSQATAHAVDEGAMNIGVSNRELSI